MIFFWMRRGLSRLPLSVQTCCRETVTLTRSRHQILSLSGRIMRMLKISWKQIPFTQIHTSHLHHSQMRVTKPNQIPEHLYKKSRRPRFRLCWINLNIFTERTTIGNTIQSNLRETIRRPMWPYFSCRSSHFQRIKELEGRSWRRVQSLKQQQTCTLKRFPEGAKAISTPFDIRMRCLKMEQLVGTRQDLLLMVAFKEILITLTLQLWNSLTFAALELLEYPEVMK